VVFPALASASILAFCFSFNSFLIASSSSLPGAGPLLQPNANVQIEAQINIQTNFFDIGNLQNRHIAAVLDWQPSAGTTT
jgi:hypothetical protein